MKSKVKAFIAVVGVLLVVTAVSLILMSRGPLYGEAAKDNWVPDLIGEWTTELSGYYFEAVHSSFLEPQYYEGSLENGFHITYQTGKTFAGHWSEPGSDPEGDTFKCTGIMLPDRTVSIQYFEPSEERWFITGRMTRSGGRLQIEGYLHYFDDLMDADELVDRMMASAYIRLIKID